jgi:DNA/RNA-binding domain of Phe-tRNA-synthetase-like protein
MKFSYDAAVWERCPELVVGIVWVTGVTNRDADAAIEARLADTERETRARFPTPPEIARAPPIAAWRAVYTRLGVKASRYPCAAEGLIRRVVETGALPRLTSLVDLTNSTSLAAMLPVAPLDLAAVTGDLQVRFADGTERFRSINASEPEPVPAGEVVYIDATPDALSRRWNWRQAEKGKVTLTVRDLLITTEAVHAGARDAAVWVVAALAEAIPAHFGGRATTAILTPEHPASVRH